MQAVSDGTVSPDAAHAAIQRHYGGRVRTVAEGATAEIAHMKALDA